MQWISRWSAVVLLLVSVLMEVKAQGVVIYETADHAAPTLRLVDAQGKWQEVDATERGHVLSGRNSWQVPDLSHPQRVLVLLIGSNYRNAPRAEVRSMFEGAGPNSLKSFYERESGGRLKFAPFTFQELVLPEDNGCLLPYDLLLASYREQSGDSLIAFDQVFFMGVLDDARCPNRPYYPAFATLGDMRVQNQYGSYDLGLTWFQDEYYGPHLAGLVLHEYGHNLGWAHSNLVSPEFHIEYGDHRDVMGAGSCCSGNVEISATRKMVMGWPAEVRRYQPSQYGESWNLKHNARIPVVLALPIRQIVLKQPLHGRPLLTLTLESATYFSDGTVRRPAGIVPRLVNAELPNSQHSLLYDPLFTPVQAHTEQVLSRVGSFAIPGTTLTVIVDAIDGDRSARLRVLDASEPSAVTLHSMPWPNACYHRELEIRGTAAPVEWLGWSLLRGGIQESFGALDMANGRKRALFAGSSALSVSGWVRNADLTHTVYGFDAPRAECALQAPVLILSQQRASVDPCGAVLSKLAYSGSPGIPLVAQTGGALTYFSGSVSWVQTELDSRNGHSTFWMERQDPFSWGALGTSYVPPIECPGRPVPQLSFAAPIVSTDCRTAAFVVRQDQPAPAGSYLDLNLVHSTAAGLVANSSCRMSSDLPGAYSCQMQSTQSLQDVRFVASARTASDSAAQRGVLRCPGS